MSSDAVTREESARRQFNGGCTQAEFLEQVAHAGEVLRDASRQPASAPVDPGFYQHVCTRESMGDF